LTPSSVKAASGVGEDNWANVVCIGEEISKLIDRLSRVKLNGVIIRYVPRIIVLSLFSGAEPLLLIIYEVKMSLRDKRKTLHTSEEFSFSY
jgi:hypothetical protein